MKLAGSQPQRSIVRIAVHNKTSPFFLSFQSHQTRKTTIANVQFLAYLLLTKKASENRKKGLTIHQINWVFIARKGTTENVWLSTHAHTHNDTGKNFY